MIKVIVVGADTELTIGAGRRVGVDKTSRIIAAKKTECRIVRVEDNITICRVKLTPDEVLSDARVTITRPE